MSSPHAGYEQRPANISRGVSLLLGGVLLVAAGMKLYGLSVSPLPSVGWLSVPSVQYAAVAAELAVGGWLISGAARPLAWLAALALFGTFTVVSGYLGVIGQASCGCFGTIQASPWAAFGVDVAAVALLLAARPGRAAWQSEPVRPLFLQATKLLGGAAFVLVLLALGSSFLFGSVSAALAKLRGESLGAPQYVDFGTAKPGEVREETVPITNWTDRPIRLIGGTSDCSCITTKDMPVTILSNETYELTIRLKVPQSTPGGFTRTVAILTDCDEQRGIKIRLGCHVE